jgi:hypothetical protein
LMPLPPMSMPSTGLLRTVSSLMLASLAISGRRGESLIPVRHHRGLAGRLSWRTHQAYSVGSKAYELEK